jgi:hypothetical protein
MTRRSGAGSSARCLITRGASRGWPSTAASTDERGAGSPGSSESATNVKILAGRPVRGAVPAYDRAVNPERARWTRLQFLASEVADRSRECAAVATSMSEAIDDIAAGARPHLAGAFSAPIGPSPFRDERDVIAAAETALFVAAVIRLRAVEGGFWTDVARQNALLRWIVRVLAPVGEPGEGEIKARAADTNAA